MEELFKYRRDLLWFLCVLGLIGLAFVVELFFLLLLFLLELLPLLLFLLRLVNGLLLLRGTSLGLLCIGHESGVTLGLALFVLSFQFYEFGKVLTFADFLLFGFGLFGLVLLGRLDVFLALRLVDTFLLLVLGLFNVYFTLIGLGWRDILLELGLEFFERFVLFLLE